MAIFRLTAMVLVTATAVSFAASSAAAARTVADPPELRGSTGAFTIAETPAPAPDLTFTGPDGTPRTLADFKGKLVLLNLWATWCAPCVKEMPALDRLQAELGGPDFEVVALSLDRGGRNQVEPFYKDRNIQHLGIYLDPKSTAMKAFKPRGLPTTYLIGKDGTLLGRLEGEAEWDGAQAKALIRHFLAPE